MLHYFLGVLYQIPLGNCLLLPKYIKKLLSPTSYLKKLGLFLVKIISKNTDTIA